jgi:hypothetical protein
VGGLQRPTQVRDGSPGAHSNSLTREDAPFDVLEPLVMPGIRHLQVRLDGLIGSLQTWSVNPKFDWPPDSIPTQAVMDAWAAAIESGGTQTGLPLQAQLSTAVRVTGVTCTYLNDDNDAVVVSKRVFATPLVGTGTAKMPPQSAVVATLLTNVPGRSARGRLYWPALALTLSSSTLRIAPADQQTIAGGTSAWLQALEAAWPGSEDIRSTVNSRVKGTNTPVTAIRVGDVVDTQRRRRDQLLEANYVTPV